jgi:glutamyl-tRNA reductase
VDRFDAVVVSTSANEPIILKSHFRTEKRRLVVDLSVPVNVDPAAAQLPGMLLANVDDISAILDRTIERRTQEIPRAEAIIALYEEEFYQWLHTYRHTPAIRLAKQQLTDLGRLSVGKCEMADEAMATHPDLNELVQETVNHLMVTLKSGSEKGCQFIEAYHKFLNHPAFAAVHSS